MGEAKRRKEAGDKVYDIPKEYRDLEGRRLANRTDKMKRKAAHTKLPLPLPGREGRKEGEGFRKDPIIDLTTKRKDKKRAEPKAINRSMRRQKRGARSS